jgi:hypothetical protein
MNALSIGKIFGYQFSRKHSNKSKVLRLFSAGMTEKVVILASFR